MNKVENKIRNAVLGFVIGDAVGVPFEFQTRKKLAYNPATDLTGYGTHNQPPGTFSDDTSMMLILMEWLIKVRNKKSVANINYRDYEELKEMWANFYRHGYWTAHGHAFDIGIQTKTALFHHQLFSDISLDPSAQGNGALMRVMPFGFFRAKDQTHDYALKAAMRRTCDVTHGAAISQACCEQYVKIINDSLYNRKFEVNENIPLPGEDNGWVHYTFDSILYTIRNNEISPDNFKKCILCAVNLGNDTDTVAALVGGLIGAHFSGKNDLPLDWLSQIIKLDEIEDLIERFCHSLRS